MKEQDRRSYRADSGITMFYELKPTLRRVLASTVPYGESICTRGKHVYCAYSGDRLVCMAATAKEARTLYKRAAMGGAYGRAPIIYPAGLRPAEDK